MVIGTSAGSINAACLAYLDMNADQLTQFDLKMARLLFGISSMHTAWNFLSSASSSMYSGAALDQLLQELLGNRPMKQMDNVPLVCLFFFFALI